MFIVPNCDRMLARHVLAALRIEWTPPFRGTAWRAQLSAGYCIVGPESPLGDREIIERVASAKRVAKDRRDCAAFVGDDLGDAPEIEPID